MFYILAVVFIFIIKLYIFVHEFSIYLIIYVLYMYVCVKVRGYKYRHYGFNWLENNLYVLINLNY